MNKQELQRLIDEAIAAQDKLDAALRAIEKHVGAGDLDGLDEIIDTCDADGLIEWAIEQGYEVKQ